MTKSLLIIALGAIMVVLCLALKDLFGAEHSQLNRKLQLRVGLSLLLLAIVIAAYVLGELDVSPYVQYL